MKIAICSDELYPVNDFVVQELKRRGHEPICFGALKTRQDEPWAKVAQEAAEAIRRKECQEGIFFCWTGTGITIAANKIPGIRAALCGDAQTAANARIWNHANVLALSNRLITIDLAKEILSAWFETPLNPKGQAGVDGIALIEQNYYK